MSDNESKYNDSLTDAWAATVVIALVVGTVVFWLSSQPGAMTWW